MNRRNRITEMLQKRRRRTKKTQGFLPLARLNAFLLKKRLPPLPGFMPNFDFLPALPEVEKKSRKTQEVTQEAVEKKSETPSGVPSVEK